MFLVKLSQYCHFEIVPKTHSIALVLRYTLFILGIPSIAPRVLSRFLSLLLSYYPAKKKKVSSTIPL